MVVRHVAERVHARTRLADGEIAVVRDDGLLVRHHRVVPAADARIDVRGHVHEVARARQQLAQRVCRRDALGRVRRRLDRVHVEVQRAGVLGVARHHRFERRDDLGGMALRLAGGVPVVPGLQVHHRLRVQRRHVDVVRVLRGELAHRGRIGLVERAAVFRRILGVPRRQGLDERLFLLRRARGRALCPLQAVPGFRAVGRVHGRVHVRAEDERGAPPAHCAVRVELGGFQERAFGRVVVEAVGHREALVEPALDVGILRGDRHAVVAEALDEGGADRREIGQCRIPLRLAIQPESDGGERDDDDREHEIAIHGNVPGCEWALRYSDSPRNSIRPQVESGPFPGGRNEKSVHIPPVTAGVRSLRDPAACRLLCRERGGARLRQAGRPVRGLARLRTSAAEGRRARLHCRHLRAAPRGTRRVPRAAGGHRHAELARRGAHRPPAGRRGDGRIRLLRARAEALGAGSRVLPDRLGRSERHPGPRRDRAPRDHRRLDLRVSPLDGRGGEAREGPGGDPAAQRPGERQPDRQRARPLGHGRRHDPQAGRFPGCACEEVGWQRTGTRGRDPGRPRVHRRVRRLAGRAGAVENRPVRRRTRQLHLEPAERPPRADDLGRGSHAAQAGARPHARRAQAGGRAQSRAARIARDPVERGIPAARQRGGDPLPRLPREKEALSHARQHGPGAARAPRRVRAARNAEFLRDRDPLRAAHALHALLPLVGPRPDARRAAPEPDPPRSPPLQHLGQPIGRHGDRHGRVDAERGPVRRPAARARDRLDHARPARGARPRFAVRARQHVRPSAGKGLPGGMDAARLDAPGPRPARLRAAALPAPARVRHELRDGQAPPRGPDPPARAAARQGLQHAPVLRRGERRGHDPGADDPVAGARAGGRTMKTLTILAALAFATAASAETTLDYNVLHAGKKSGAQKTVIRDDGKVHVSYSYRDNGRGPDIEEDITLLPDGTFRSYRQTGKTTFGAILDERFSISGRRASWQSPAERGSQTLTAPAVYLPSYGSPETSAVIVRATQKAGGRLAALPGGELRSEKLATARVGPAGKEREVALYAIRGAALQPDYVWLESGADMPLFANINVGGSHMVVAGFEVVTPELERLQQQAETKYLEDLAAKHTQALPQPILIKNVRIFDAKSKALGEPADVYVNDGRIAAIYPAGSPARDPATVIDGAGRALLPGLFDMHTHEDAWNAILQVAGGVTSSRDMGNDNAYLARLKSDIAAGRTIGPHIEPAGYIEGESPFSSRGGFVVASVAEAENAVDWYAERGFRQVKLYNSIKPEWAGPIAAYAHSRGLRVSGHVPAFSRSERVVREGYEDRKSTRLNSSHSQISYA